MVVSKLLEFIFHDTGNISSSDPVLGLSLITLLEAFAPGYNQIHKFLLFNFGLDVTILVFLGVVLWLGTRIFRLVWTVVKTTIASNYIAEITISSLDEIYKHIIAFLVY
jgi:mitochondrial chaperone BCS1